MPMRYLLFLLLVFGIAMPAEAQTPNRQTATTVVTEQIRAATLKEAMLAAINRHPEADRWSGVDDRHIFGISVVTLTDRAVRERDTRLFHTTARLVAAKEMLFSKVLLDKYAETGLTDAGSLRQAVADANESFRVQGKLRYSMDETFIEGNRIVGIVAADRNNVIAIMTEQARIDAVRSAYREIVHRQTKRLIADNKFEEALNRLLELRQAELLGREQLFDVLHCFVGLDRPVDTEKIIQNLICSHSEDVMLFRNLVAITASGESNEFQRITQQLQAEIDRLDPPGLTAEQVLNELLNELLGQSPVQ